MNNKIIIMRFFLEEDAPCFATLDITNNAGLIPRSGSQVFLKDNSNYDYYIVKKIIYNYSQFDEAAIIDVIVTGINL